MMANRMVVGVVLFDQFELLDVFGPLEMFGLLPDCFEIRLLADTATTARSAQGPVSVIDASLQPAEAIDIVMVPGGIGTRHVIKDSNFLDKLQQLSRSASYVISVCTGSALLAAAGLLDGRKATTNKGAFDWVSEQRAAVQWVKQARWVEDGHFFTSSGVSAGMDMALALIAHLHGVDVAEQVALWAEYEWHREAERDPFAARRGIV